jgi:hypothetical protein
MPKDNSTEKPRFTTTYRPSTGEARLYGSTPVRSIRYSPTGARLTSRFSGPVKKIEEPISEGDTTQWDVDNGFVDPPPGYWWLYYREPSKTRPAPGVKDEEPPPLRPIRSVDWTDNYPRCKIVRFVTGPVERILVCPA